MSWTFTSPWLLLSLMAIPLMIAFTWRAGAVKQHWAQLTLRALAIASLSCALADLSVLKVADTLAVTFVIDDTTAEGGSTQQAEQFIQEALHARSAQNLAALLAPDWRPELEMFSDQGLHAWRTATQHGDTHRSNQGHFRHDQGNSRCR